VRAISFSARAFGSTSAVDSTGGATRMGRTVLR